MNEKTSLLHIGVRAHDFGRLPPGELAQRIAAKNLSCVQLALNKAIADLNLQPGDLNPGLAFHIGRAFAAHNLHLAVLGCYINLGHPDPAARAPLLRYFKDHLRYARDFGASLVATETGSLNPDWSFHPDNPSELAYKNLLPIVADLVAEAQNCGTIVGIEGVASHILNSPQRIRRLLDDIRSSSLQIVFDPVNLLSLENHRDQVRIMRESFDLFGDRIAIIHAKDFIPEPTRLQQVRAGAAPAGAGLHYKFLLEYLQSRKPLIPILLEESSESTALDSIRYLHEQARDSP